jgi:hypothetical protein
MTDTTPLLCCACVLPCAHPRDRSCPHLCCVRCSCAASEGRRRCRLSEAGSLTGAIWAIGMTSFLGARVFSSARFKGLLPSRRTSFCVVMRIGYRVVCRPSRRRSPPNKRPRRQRYVCVYVSLDARTGKRWVSRQYLALDGAYHPFSAGVPTHTTLCNASVRGR